jgi:hypothetical protein
MLRLYMTSHASDYNVQSYLVKESIWCPTRFLYLKKILLTLPEHLSSPPVLVGFFLLDLSFSM